MPVAEKKKNWYHAVLQSSGVVMSVGKSFRSGSTEIKLFECETSINQPVALEIIWVSTGALGERSLSAGDFGLYVSAARRHSDGARHLSNAHPGLAEAVGVPMVVEVLLLPGLLELVPQPLYPVMVTGGHLTAGRARKRRWDSASSCFEFK